MFRFHKLLKDTPGRHGQLLSARTCFCYFNIFASVLKSAARSRIIANNPIDALESEFKLKRPVESTREFLTETEVSLLATTPCKCEMTKRAFMFSCFCGLRLGDIRRLKWDDLISNGSHLMISIIMQKTRRPIWLPLSDAAVVWLPEKSLDLSSETIFKMHANTNISKEIKAWAICAGINKNVTFHTARHTFATLLLTKGADLYTVSKLLGHTEISTTQIYAKIIDKKKVEAVELLNGIVCQS